MVRSSEDLHLWTIKSPDSGDLSVTKATLPRTFSMSEGVKWDAPRSVGASFQIVTGTLPLKN